MRPFHLSTKQLLSRLLIIVLTIFLLIPQSLGLVNADTDTQFGGDLGDLSNPDTYLSEEPFQLTDENQGELSPEDILRNNESTIPDHLIKIDPSRIVTFSVVMPQLENREKKIIVYLPSDYETGESSYPVIYLHGAQDVFSQDLNINREWMLNQPLLDFYTSGVEGEAIIVGITSDPINKWDEYGPWVNTNMYLWMDPFDANRVEGGNGDAYLAFLIDTLKPDIDSRYRTIQGLENTAIGGYRMGGLISVYAGLTRPDVFSQVMALSPAVWFAENGGTWLSSNRLIELINTVDIPTDVSFNIDVFAADKLTDLVVRPVVYDTQGKKITFPQAYLEGTHALVAALVNRGVPIVNITSGTVDLDTWTLESIETTTDREGEYKYLFPIFFTPPPPPSPRRFESFNLTIPILNRSRKIWVYLPPNYDIDTDKKYQVIYLFSAQNMFGSDIGSYVEPVNDWQFDETLDRLYSETGKGTIAVAIEYNKDYPWDEYTPWNNSNMDNWLPGYTIVYGQGDAMRNFIVGTLWPEINARYRTYGDAVHTAIGGGSRFSHLAIYVGYTKPLYFSKVMAMSPAVWLAEGGTYGLPLYEPAWYTTNQLDNWIKTHPIPTGVKYFYHVGTNEVAGHPGSPYPYVKVNNIVRGWPYVYKNSADNIVAALRSRAIPVNYHVTTEDHLPSVWAKYVDDALRWFGFY